MIGSKILRNAEPDNCLTGRVPDRRPRFGSKSQKTPRIGEQSLAFLCQAHAFALPMQKGPADVHLKPLDLLADGGLRPVNALTRTRKTAGIHNRDEASQEIEIQHDFIHFSTGS
jgi:hypothetical protein